MVLVRQDHPVGTKRWEYLLLKNRFEPFLELLYPVVYGLQHLPWMKIQLPQGGSIQMKQTLLGGNPNAKKLVHVGGKDGHKIQTLSKWGARIFCLLQYPFVEVQPRQFPVVQIQSPTQMKFANKQRT